MASNKPGKSKSTATRRTSGLPAGQTEVWGPAKLLFRKALAKLAGRTGRRKRTVVLVFPMLEVSTAAVPWPCNRFFGFFFTCCNVCSRYALPYHRMAAFGTCEVMLTSAIHRKQSYPPDVCVRFGCPVCFVCHMGLLVCQTIPRAFSKCCTFKNGLVSTFCDTKKPA